MYSNWGRLFTHPEYQGRGFGNETMDATERFVFDEQYADLSLLSDLMHSATSIAIEGGNLWRSRCCPTPLTEFVD